MRKEGTLNYFKGFRNPTWFPILDGAVQTIVPFTQDDEEIFGHTLIQLWYTRNQPNGRDSELKSNNLFLFPFGNYIPSSHRDM